LGSTWESPWALALALPLGTGLSKWIHYYNTRWKTRNSPILNGSKQATSKGFQSTHLMSHQNLTSARASKLGATSDFRVLPQVPTLALTLVLALLSATLAAELGHSALLDKRHCIRMRQNTMFLHPIPNDPCSESSICMRLDLEYRCSRSSTTTEACIYRM